MWVFIPRTYQLDDQKSIRQKLIFSLQKEIFDLVILHLLQNERITKSFVLEIAPFQMGFNIMRSKHVQQLKMQHVYCFPLNKTLNSTKAVERILQGKVSDHLSFMEAFKMSRKDFYTMYLSRKIDYVILFHSC